MAASELTKKAINQAFLEILEKKPLDKITVRDITENCGINRNTFYYHFHSIYDLLEHLFYEEEQRLTENISGVQTLKQAFEESARFALENRRAIYHVYNSVNRNVLTSYLYTAAEVGMRRVVENQCHGLEPAPEDVDDLVFLYASMLEGAILNIIGEGFNRDIDALIANAIRLLEGTIRRALENSNPA